MTGLPCRPRNLLARFWGRYVLTAFEPGVRGIRSLPDLPDPIGLVVAARYFLVEEYTLLWRRTRRRRNRRRRPGS